MTCWILVALGLVALALWSPQEYGFLMFILMLEISCRALTFDLALATCGVHTCYSNTYGLHLTPAIRRVEI